MNLTKLAPQLMLHVLLRLLRPGLFSVIPTPPTISPACLTSTPPGLGSGGTPASRLRRLAPSQRGRIPDTLDCAILPLVHPKLLHNPRSHLRIRRVEVPRPCWCRIDVALSLAFFDRDLRKQFVLQHKRSSRCVGSHWSSNNQIDGLKVLTQLTLNTLSCADQQHVALFHKSKTDANVTTIVVFPSFAIGG